MRLQEILTEGSFEWDSEHDKDTFISLKGLVNKNNGVFKSIKQQKFIKDVTIAKEPKRGHSFAESNYGVKFDQEEHLIVVSAMTRHAKYGDRSLVPVFYGFVLDDFGVVSFWRIGVKGNMRDGAGPNPEKTKLEWSRPMDADIQHLIPDPKEVEAAKKKEFKIKLGMSEGDYIGTEGARMNFGELKLVAKKHMGYSQFGYNQSVEKYWNMYKDTNGNIIYHTGKQGPEKGEKFNVTGTVKKHLVNKKGQKVTVIIRPRFKMIEQITEDLSIKDFPVMFKLKNTKWAMRMSKDLNRDGISASVENTVVTVNKPSFIIGPQVVQNTAAVYDAEQIFHYENH